MLETTILTVRLYDFALDLSRCFVLTLFRFADLFYAKTPQFFFIPHGNMNLYASGYVSTPPPITSQPNEQAVAFLVDLTGPAVSDFLWDPTVQLTLLFDNMDATPGAAPSLENAISVVGIAVGVSVAVAVVLGVVRACL